MNVMPAIDLLDGRVVRLKKGDYRQVTVYHEDPVAQAQAFADAGFDTLHVVDLNGARDGGFPHLPLLERIASATGLRIQTGGGVRRYDDVRRLFEAGMHRVVSGSMAVRTPEDWLKALSDYGERCVFGLDLKDGKAAVAGWTTTSETPIDALLAPMIAAGLRIVLCTDIARDGMMTGANHGLYADLMRQWPVLRFIASGGVAGPEDLARLAAADVWGVVVGRAYFENAIDLGTLRKFHG